MACEHCGSNGEFVTCPICKKQVCKDCYGEHAVCICPEVRWNSDGGGHPAEYENCCGECAEKNEAKKCGR